MKVTTVESAQRVPFRLDGRILLSGKNTEIIHLSLKPNEALPPHVNDFDVAIYVIEGRGMIESGNQQAEVQAGMIAEIPSGAQRGMRNTGDRPLRVLVIKLFSN